MVSFGKLSYVKKCVIQSQEIIMEAKLLSLSNHYQDRPKKPGAERDSRKFLDFDF
jgi:hypothetical protein